MIEMYITVAIIATAMLIFAILVKPDKKEQK